MISCNVCYRADMPKPSALIGAIVRLNIRAGWAMARGAADQPLRFFFFKLASAPCDIPTREQAMQDFKAQWLETLLGRDAKGSVL